MDLWTFLVSASAKEMSATVIVVAVVIAIFTGVLVPGRTHTREMKAATEVAVQHQRASEKKDEVIKDLIDQNAKLLGAVRVADHFFRDFLEDQPPAEGH